jgi:prepilin-type processing-associated H-X9-DG protein
MMVVETSKDNGPWFAGGRPTARPFDPTGATPVGRAGQFGGHHDGGVNILFVDAHVSFIRDTVSAEALSSRMTIVAPDRLFALPE